MNRKLLVAVAVPCFVAAPAGYAQTTGPVTLYGRVDVALETVKGEGAASVPSRNRVTSHSSRLGFRTSEDLGGGLKAFAQIESQVNVDTGSPAGGGRVLASRNSGVGLQGAFGSVVIGRWDTPYKLLVVDLDPFNTLTIAAADGVFADASNFARREDNVVQYWSPSWGPLAVRAHYSANEGKTAAANPHTYSVSFAYAGKPLKIGYAYERHIDSRNGTTTAGFTESGQLVTVQAAFGGLRVGAGYEQVRKTGLKTVKDILLMAQYDAGPHSVFASYARSKDGAASAAAQPEGKLLGVGYAYSLSKRTSIRAHYARIDNNAFSAFNFGAGGLGGVTAGVDPSGFGAGIRHNF